MAFTLSQLNALGANVAKRKPPPKRTDAYDDAIAKHKAFIESQAKDWGGVWDRTYDGEEEVLRGQTENLSNRYLTLQGQKDSWIAQAKAADAAAGGEWPGDEYEARFNADYPSFVEKLAATREERDAASFAYDQKRKGRKDAREAAYTERFAPRYAAIEQAAAAAEKLRERTRKQAQFDADYYQAQEAYKSAVTQHDKDRAAYAMYLAQKPMYDQDSADRQADIDAGRYAVNPYQFMAQGAGINEIEELRKQVNAGNLRPNMRVPDALVAPTEVKDPGKFEGTAPVHGRAEEPEVSGEIADILGYKPPEKPKEDAPLPQVSSEDIDTSSVTSQYESPAEKEKKPEPEKDASGNPVVAQPTGAQPTGAGTLQQTSQATTSPTQQTATQAATPAPALPAQPTGSVAGQGSNTGQAPETQAPPKTEEKPAPFTADEEEKDKQDSVF